MFLISKCRGDRDLGLCTTSVLAFGEPQRDGKIREKTCFDVGKIGFCHRAGVRKQKGKKKRKDKNVSLLYILFNLDSTENPL